jgi:hypothetical protein
VVIKGRQLNIPVVGALGGHYSVAKYTDVYDTFGFREMTTVEFMVCEYVCCHCQCVNVIVLYLCLQTPFVVNSLRWFEFMTRIYYLKAYSVINKIMGSVAIWLRGLYV